MVWYIMLEGGFIGKHIQTSVGVLFIGIASVNVLWAEGQRQTKGRK